MSRKIIVYNPEGLLNDGGYRFHGYITEYVKKYADYVFVPNPIKACKIAKILKSYECAKKIKVVCTLARINKSENIIVGFGADRNRTYGMEKFQGKIVFHLMDYYIDAPNVKSYLRALQVDYVIGHCQMDKACEFFDEYYPEYIGKVIDLPFGYEKRFKSKKNFSERKKKAIGLGSINLMSDQRLSEEATHEMKVFFGNRKYQHEVRAYLRDHEDEFSDVIDAKFPSDKQQKDFSYDAVEMLNDYQMFINDEGFSNFPPARTYEGIACGCVMVAPVSPIYSNIGFDAGINYIGYEKNNYQDLHDKILYYIEHQEELIELQKNSIVLAKEFSHEQIADRLQKSIQRI